MDFNKLFERTLPARGFDEFQDLEGWRVYYIGNMLFVALIILPVGLISSLPNYLAQGKYELIAVELFVIAFIAAILRIRYTPHFIKIFFILLYGLMLTFIFALGPLYARPGWMVMSVVSAAFLFGVRATLMTTAINLILLFVLYWQIGPHLAAWAPVYKEPFSLWLMFAVSVSLISLFAGLPVGLLLERMNRLSLHEHDLRTQLEREREALQSMNEVLRTEISERRKAEEKKIVFSVN